MAAAIFRAAAVLDAVLSAENAAISRDQAVALLIGPIFFSILSGQDPATINAGDLAGTVLLALREGARTRWIGPTRTARGATTRRPRRR
ncbi:hypothetical protein [Spongiactinospora sp. 9N601]|uniref:hypothetical protein n=1 Tax=Spongiactinospora sp. 9N601 TaxID=3375149 RepID=UPI0037B3A5CD